MKYKGTRYTIVRAYTPAIGNHVYIAQSNRTCVVFQSQTFYYEGETVVLNSNTAKELVDREDFDRVLQLMGNDIRGAL